ncbi:MAG: hypothetical protein WB689_22815 [Xanthobacteraceae bacterium]
MPGIPQVFSTSVISFTETKLRSHWPSVMPSARVLVRFPLHVILSVEAAFPSTIAPKKSRKMQTNVRRFGIATYPNGRYDMRDLSETAMVAAMGLQTDLTVNQGVRALVMPIGSRRSSKPFEHAIFNEIILVLMAAAILGALSFSGLATLATARR